MMQDLNLKIREKIIRLLYFNCGSINGMLNCVFKMRFLSSNKFFIVFLMDVFLFFYFRLFCFFSLFFLLGL